ncbi:hypothetical protein R3P38DRAFT_3027177 [Favolaschia claudopus]|uniref:BTB domain-containing protein n=1 Tax=Favolaschia claudopus TaxID=2862362 RepID=A0AAW0AG25_9AGAR
MALQKACEDEWTLSGVKSTFTIPIPGSLTSEASGLFTDICGWGWRFSCMVSAASTTEPPRLLNANSDIPIPWRRISMYFDPYLISDVNYGKVTFHLETKNLAVMPHEHSFSQVVLPISSSSGDKVKRKSSASIRSISSHRVALQPYMYRGDAVELPTISIRVQFPTDLGMALPRPLDTSVEDALAETIQGADIIDMKFYAYTRAGFTPEGKGYVARPRSLFAKLGLLRGHSDSLDTYISALTGTAGVNFAEAKMVDLDGDMDVEKRFDDYDCMSDSDLDPDEEAEREGEASISEDASIVVEHQGLAFPDSNLASPMSASQLLVTRRKGRVVVIKGHAFKTWHALLHYLYTNKIAFRTPDGSQQRPSNVPKCSAKSMYRLADRFGLEDLKALALKSIKAQLSPDNIIHEVFSSFTSLYPEIVDLEVEFLLKHLPSLKEDMEKMLKDICGGTRPHSFLILSKIIYRQEQELFSAPSASPRSELGQAIELRRSESPMPPRSNSPGLRFRSPGPRTPNAEY